MSSVYGLNGSFSTEAAANYRCMSDGYKDVVHMNSDGFAVSNFLELEYQNENITYTYDKNNFSNFKMNNALLKYRLELAKYSDSFWNNGRKVSFSVSGNGGLGFVQGNKPQDFVYTYGDDIKLQVENKWSPNQKAQIGGIFNINAKSQWYNSQNTKNPAIPEKMFNASGAANIGLKLDVDPYISAYVTAGPQYEYNTVVVNNEKFSYNAPSANLNLGISGNIRFDENSGAFFKWFVECIYNYNCKNVNGENASDGNRSTCKFKGGIRLGF